MREEALKTLALFIDEATGEAPLNVVYKGLAYERLYFNYVPDTVVGTEGYKPTAETNDTIFDRRSGVHEQAGILPVGQRSRTRSVPDPCRRHERGTDDATHVRLHRTGRNGQVSVH